MRNPQPKNFTWLFLATYDDPLVLPVVLHAQGNTEDEARSQLTGDFSLT
ncbi:host cell division inhibitor Icd-like protein, partial [Klebsiella quasipneumoniae]